MMEKERVRRREKVREGVEESESERGNREIGGHMNT